MLINDKKHLLLTLKYYDNLVLFLTHVVLQMISRMMSVCEGEEVQAKTLNGQQPGK